MFITASAAAHANGLPENVPPSSPAPGVFTTSARPTTALKGIPAASDLEVVIRSGTIPKFSIANNLPVRQKPVWISSKKNTVFLTEVINVFNKTFWLNYETTLTLYWFHDNTCHCVW